MSAEQSLSSAPTWQEKITNFLVDKYEADFAKYLKDVLKNIGRAYQAENFFGSEELAFIFDTRKNKKFAEQKETEFILQQIARLQDFGDQPSQLDFESLTSDINAQKQALLDKYSPEIWLTWAAENAKNVSFATHVSKLTHSAIDSPSFFDSSTIQKNAYLSTNSLENIAIDGAVRGNQYAPIYQFLELELNNKKLATEFKNPETNLLEIFAPSTEQKLIWNQGFAAALNTGKLAAHFLLKQVYFPISNSNYHLLCNQVSSSKAQALFEFSRRNSNDTFKLKNNNKYSKETYFNFPNRASISITASNHGNASQLNGKRGGRLGLFSCQPPVWHSQLKPPIYKNNFFFELSRNYEVRENIQFLADFLVRFEFLQLSIKDPKRMRWIEKWIENLADEVLVYVKSIQALPAGWSATEGIKLKLAHQILLDCYRTDEEFLAMQGSNNWQVVIIQDFSAWLNNSLRKVEKTFTPTDAHSRLWAKLFENNFREVLDTNISVQSVV